MRKYYSIGIGILCFLFVTPSHAQKKNEPKKPKPIQLDETGLRMVGIHAGLSLTGVLYDAMKGDTITKLYTTDVKPAFQLTYDKIKSKKTSLGFFASIQPFKVDISHWEYGDTLKPSKIDNLHVSMKRIYLGGKCLYHYKNTAKVDMYIGIRAGGLFWNKKYNTQDTGFINAFKEEFLMLNRPALNFIPLGMCIKFTPEFVANIEINAGAPHLLSFGCSYRFK